MALGWWELPGNSQLIGDVADTLRSGRNVVLRAPESAYAGLATALRSALESAHVEWVDFSPKKHGQPIDELFERFASASPAREIRTPRTLVKYPTFEGLLVWVEPACADDWRAWADFLTEYERVCRSVEPLEQTLFCVACRGDACRYVIEDEVCLMSVSCQGSVRREDVQLYVGLLLDERGLDGIERDLMCRLITHLAMWDVEAVRQLAHADLASLLEPMSMLKEIAEVRRWDGLADADWETLWIAGAAEKFDGEWRKHSACLSMGDAERELARRIWSAQVEVLLPWIEARRRWLLEQFGSRIRLPFTARDGRTIHDVRDLEIGHIQHLLYQLPLRPSAEVMDSVRALKTIRNALSHLEPVGFELLGSSLRALGGKQQ